jgi:molybdate/tungstate transport system permease protein
MSRNETPLTLVLRQDRAASATRGSSHWRGPAHWLLLAPGLVCVLYLIAPLLYFWTRVSWSNVGPVLSDSRTTDALRTSLTTSTVATALMGFFGVPLAHVLARRQLPPLLHRLATLTAVMPLAFPPLISGIMLLVLFGPYGAIGGILDAHGIETFNSSIGIVLAQVFVSAPLVVISARSAFESIAPDLEAAAAIHGAGSWNTFRHITLPLASRSIAAGLLLAWMRSLGEFGATIVLAYHPYSLPVFTWVQLSATGLASALPLVMLMLIIGLSASAIATLTRAWQPTAA